jgi:hypothetical protein
MGAPLTHASSSAARTATNNRSGRLRVSLTEPFRRDPHATGKEHADLAAQGTMPRSVRWRPFRTSAIGLFRLSAPVEYETP